MNMSYYNPWIGKDYNTTKTLILSESAYSWRDRSGKAIHPSPSHPEDSLFQWIDRFPKQRYFAAMSRVLCGTESPDIDQMRREWNKHAYSIYVQRSVGLGARVRPSHQQWRDAGPHFLSLIEKIRPVKVIVTGKQMWKQMPSAAGFLLDDLQAYRLSDDSLVWCLALPHPSNSHQGFQWRNYSDSVRIFKSTQLPLRT
jgi:hypothetical protein